MDKNELAYKIYTLLDCLTTEQRNKFLENLPVSIRKEEVEESAGWYEFDHGSISFTKGFRIVWVSQTITDLEAIVRSLEQLPKKSTC